VRTPPSHISWHRFLHSILNLTWIYLIHILTYYLTSSPKLHCIWRLSWHSIWHSYLTSSGNLSQTYSLAFYVTSDMSSNILCCHWHSVWHSIWHIFRHFIGQSLAVYLAFLSGIYVAVLSGIVSTCYLAFYPILSDIIFYLTYFLTFYLGLYLLVGILSFNFSGILSDILSGIRFGSVGARRAGKLVVFRSVKAQGARSSVRVHRGQGAVGKFCWNLETLTWQVGNTKKGCLSLRLFEPKQFNGLFPLLTSR